MVLVVTLARTTSLAVRIAGGGSAVVLVADIKAGARHVVLEQGIGKNGIPWRWKSLLVMLVMLVGRGSVGSWCWVGDAVPLASVCLREAALTHGGGLGYRCMTLCGDVAVIKTVVIEAGVVVEACGKGVHAMGQRHVEGGEVIEIQRHGGHVIGGGAGKRHVRRVVFHDELGQELKKLAETRLLRRRRGAGEALCLLGRGTARAGQERDAEAELR